MRYTWSAIALLFAAVLLVSYTFGARLVFEESLGAPPAVKKPAVRSAL